MKHVLKTKHENTFVLNVQIFFENKTWYGYSVPLTTEIEKPWHGPRCRAASWFVGKARFALKKKISKNVLENPNIQFNFSCIMPNPYTLFGPRVNFQKKWSFKKYYQKDKYSEKTRFWKQFTHFFQK